VLSSYERPVRSTGRKRFSDPEPQEVSGSLQRFGCALRRLPMKTRSPGRGRRKAVEKFTSRQGLWMLGILVLVWIFVLIDALENVK